MARQIEAYKLRTEIAVDNTKASAAMRGLEKDVDRVGARFKKLGPEIDGALKGKEAGFKFGQNFSAGATAVITGSFDSLGQTLGSVLGTAMMPGIGTAIGSVVGSGVDAAVAKVGGIVGPLIKQGIELNRELKKTKVEFTTFAGSEAEAVKYLEQLKKLAVDSGTDFRWVLETSEHVYDLTNNLELTNQILKAATEQAADFGGEAETIGKVAEQLGLIAEKGNLAGRELQKLFKLGIDAKKYLATATGMSEKQIERLMAEDRIRGDVAARLISEGITREKGGFAAKLTEQARPEARFEVLTQLRAAEGTEAATQAIEDLYRQANRLLSSDQAQKFTRFINETTQSITDLTKKGISAGVSLSTGLAEGMAGVNAFKAVGAGVTELGNFVEDQFKSFFKIQSPSLLTNETIGVPIGEGIADGISAGFIKGFGQTREEIIATLQTLLQDPRIRAFFETIKTAEGGAPNIIVGGKHFSDMSRHPNVVGLRTSKGPSTAAGSYQITGTTWRAIQKTLGLPDFSSESQLLAALAIFAGRQGGAGVTALQGGDIDTAMRIAGMDWTSTPGSKIGGGRQWDRGKWVGTFNRNLANMTGGSAPMGTAAGAPVPVVVLNMPGAGAGGGTSGRGVLEGTGYSKNVLDFLYGAGAPQQKGGQGQATGALENFVEVLNDAQPVIVNVAASTEELIATDTKRADELIRSNHMATRSLIPLIGAEAAHAQTAITLTKEYQEAARNQLVIGRSFLTQLSGAIGAVAGMVPQEQVGKKRGFFSKILGIAAPFLSFIPGVGPLLSTIAGIASAGIGGDWGAVATGVAGGLAPGGAFRPGAGGPAPKKPTKVANRAAGGPVYAGERYIIGERGWETFEPMTDGYIQPHGAGAGEIAAAARELRAAVAHLNSMPANHVVMRGARGLIRAMDGDAGLIRLMGQRQRFS